MIEFPFLFFSAFVYYCIIFADSCEIRMSYLLEEDYVYVCRFRKSASMLIFVFDAIPWILRVAILYVWNM